MIKLPDRPPPRPFEARYHGECPTCGGHIYPGDPVIFDGEDCLLHEECDDR